MSNTPIKVLVAGGSYAGLGAICNLLAFSLGRNARFGAATTIPNEAKVGFPLQIHLVDERDGYLHLIGSPLAFASEDYASKIWTKFEDIPALQHPSVRFTRGSIIKIDPSELTATARLSGSNEKIKLQYDYFVAATGLRRRFPVVPQSLTCEEYLEETSKHIRSVDASKSVAVIGGGAVGIEMAAELKAVNDALDVHLVHSRDQLLSSEPLPVECSTATIAALEDLGVKLHMKKRVTRIDSIEAADGVSSKQLDLSDGSHLQVDQVIEAISQGRPSTAYVPPSCLNAEGYIKINNELRFAEGSSQYERHFACGDAVAWSGIKRCGGALAMSRLVADNIFQHIMSTRYGLKPSYELLPEFPAVIAIAIGKQAMGYYKEGGVTCSEENMQVYFRDDLGFQQCWDHMKLSEAW